MGAFDVFENYHIFIYPYSFSTCSMVCTKEIFSEMSQQLDWTINTKNVDLVYILSDYTN